MKFDVSTLAAALVALAASSVLATPTWTTGSTTGSGGFTPAANNIIAGLKTDPVSNGSAGAEGTGGRGVLTDGLYGSKNAERYTIGNNAVLTYQFPGGIPYAVSGVNLYSQWNDTGRDRIDVASIELCDPDGNWTTVPGSSVSYDDGSYNCFAKLSDPDTGFLSGGSIAVRINFAGQENGYVGYLEIEVTGVPASDLTVINPITGSEDYLGTNAIAIAVLPVLAGFDEYQITLGTDESAIDPNGWLTYTPGVTPTGLFDFEAPAADGEITFTAWFRASAGGVDMAKASDSILFSTVPPTAVAKNAAIGINAGAGSTVPVDLVDDGSSDSLSGLYSVTVVPSVIYAPGTVTLVVMNNAGIVSTATAQVASSGPLDPYISPDGDDGAGDGTAAHPFRTIAHAATLVAPTTLETIHLAPGTYSPSANGEVFPIALGSTSIACDFGEGRATIDGEDASANMFTVPENCSLSLVGLDLLGTTDALVSARTAAIAATNCTFTQTKQDCGEWSNGAFYLHTSCTLEAVGCAFTNMLCGAVIRCEGNDGCGSKITFRDCLVADNQVAINGGSGSLIFTRIHGCAFNFYGTTFSNNRTANGAVHDACRSPICYADFTPLDIDRCQFLGNQGGNLFGVCYANADIRNSLFVDNNNPDGIYHGYSTTGFFRNCTFIRCYGGFTGYDATSRLYNCILSGLNGLNPALTYHSGNPNKQYFHDTIIHDTPYDTTHYNAAASSNVMAGVDPVFENAGVAWDADGFDARPRPYSPAIDAGANANVLASDVADLDGSARIADNDGDGTATVDLGCYESLFGAAVKPTFTVPVPGKLGGFRGVTYSIPVSISPAASGAVAASVTYGEGLTGPATLSFEGGSATATLEFSVPSSTNTFARITIADAADPAAVLPANFDVFIDDLVLTTGGTQFFVREGDTLDIPLSLALDGAVAPGDVAFALDSVTGTGTSTAAIEGSAVIPEGAHVSSGAVRVTGGLGVNTVTLTTGAKFAESGTDSTEITIVGYPGYMYVDPEIGDDGALGTLADPMRTITYALAVLQPGDEVRLLPGTYTSATETFPLRPASVSIVGCDATGAKAADNTLCVIDGGNEADNAVMVSGVTGESAASIENVWIRETIGGGIYFDNSDGVVSNAFFTQTVSHNTAGGIQVANICQVDAIDCCFSGMVRRAAVYCSAADTASEKRFSALRCLFVDNTSYLGGIGANEGGKMAVSATDCDFVRNIGDPGSNVHDARAAAAIYMGGNSLAVDRCRFFGNGGNHVMGLEYASSLSLRNSLFADNGTTGGIFRGYNNNVDTRNCTFIHNAGGYATYGVGVYARNCIFYADGALSLDDGSAGRLHLHNSLVFGTVDTTYGFTDDGGNVTDMAATDPLFKNADVAWDAEGFDAHLRPVNGNKAIDGGDNAYAAGDRDLDSGARIRKGYGRNANPILVDMGCYESDLVISGTLIIVK